MFFPTMSAYFALTFNLSCSKSIGYNIFFKIFLPQNTTKLETGERSRVQPKTKERIVRFAMSTLGTFLARRTGRHSTSNFYRSPTYNTIIFFMFVNVFIA
jgi:hypothetical protein